jgi:hypothetical protein
MNYQEKYKEDLLRQHINPEMIEKAPEGFTSQVMTRIQAGTEPLKREVRESHKSIIPVISVSLTIILIISAYFTPSGSSDNSFLPGLKPDQIIDFSLFKVNLDTLFSYNMPALLPYLFISILILTIFDRALYKLFSRNKQEESENPAM